MAKYTELLSEYLNNGGQLPSSFDEIEGFEDLFVAYYCDKEIGFETEELFEIKLETYATIYIPVYKEKLEAITSAITGAITPIKTHYEHYNTTINAGKQKGYTTDLPTNALTATPNSISESDAYTNTDERETTTEESGVTVDEGWKMVDKLNEKVTPLILTLLKEFKPCFMQIY